MSGGSTRVLLGSGDNPWEVLWIALIVVVLWSIYRLIHNAIAKEREREQRSRQITPPAAPPVPPQGNWPPPVTGGQIGQLPAVPKLDPRSSPAAGSWGVPARPTAGRGPIVPPARPVPGRSFTPPPPPPVAPVRAAVKLNLDAGALKPADDSQATR